MSAKDTSARKRSITLTPMITAYSYALLQPFSNDRFGPELKSSTGGM